MGSVVWLLWQHLKGTVLVAPGSVCEDQYLMHKEEIAPSHLLYFHLVKRGEGGCLHFVFIFKYSNRYNFTRNLTLEMVHCAEIRRAVQSLMYGFVHRQTSNPLTQSPCSQFSLPFLFHCFICAYFVQKLARLSHSTTSNKPRGKHVTKLMRQRHTERYLW